MYFPESNIGFFNRWRTCGAAFSNMYLLYLKLTLLTLSKSLANTFVLFNKRTSFIKYSHCVFSGGFWWL